METTNGYRTRKAITTAEELTFEQRWLLETLFVHNAKLRFYLGIWILTINDIEQQVVPQEDILELANSDLISRGENTDRWWPTSAGRALIRPLEVEATPTPDLASSLARIAHAVEDIAAATLAIDNKLNLFMTAADAKDPWKTDAMAGLYE